MAVFLKKLITLALGLAALNASAAEVAIQIHDPWVRAAPPNVKVLAAYLEIKNNGGTSQTLTGVSSPAFAQIGIHQSVMHENRVRMEHLKELAIPPHASVVLKPGEMHLMLMNAKKPVHVGDQIPMTLTFNNKEKIAVTAIVRSGQTEEMPSPPHMNHAGGHDHHNHE